MSAKAVPQKSRPLPVSEPLGVASAPQNLFAGTSGWAYPTWKPGFYPEGLSAKKFLPFYASRMNSVEVNYTFRALPTPAMLNGWLAAVPAGFRFSFKAPQRITHFSRLRDCAATLDQFLQTLQPVREAGRMGLLLFQLPPNFKADLDRLDAFLGHSGLSGGEKAPRIAFEFRHDSWFSQAVYDRLSESQAALCVAESDDLRTPEVHCAPGHTCFRLRRNGGYTASEIEGFATRLTTLAGTREVYAYFKHEDEPTGALNGSECLRRAAALPGGRGRV